MVDMVKNALALPRLVKVDAEGTQVRLQLEDQVYTLSYDAAFEISQWLRICGRKAKENAGDTTPRFGVVGTLTLKPN